MANSFVSHVHLELGEPLCDAADYRKSLVKKKTTYHTSGKVTSLLTSQWRHR